MLAKAVSILGAADAKRVLLNREKKFPRSAGSAVQR